MALQGIVTEIPNNRKNHISWMIPAIREQHLQFDDLIERVKNFIPSLDFVDRIPAAILMFGSCSPTIHHDDIDSILQNISKGNEIPELSAFVHSVPFSPNERPYESGYNSAQSFADQCQIEGDFVDIEKILADFSIKIVDAVFSDRTMRGIALVGDGLLPTIFVNTAHPHNETSNGRRYTLAHEFCHLLYDRQYGQEVGVVSGPWAPQRVEQRANAFAAMLLMPASMIENMIDQDRDIELDVVRDMAQTLRVSKIALIEHLHNMGAMTMLKRDAMREQIEQNGEKFAG
jgi:Zn-dependent peptidase ImmA (M78 family)